MPGGWGWGWGFLGQGSIMYAYSGGSMDFWYGTRAPIDAIMTNVTGIDWPVMLTQRIPLTIYTGP